MKTQWKWIAGCAFALAASFALAAQVYWRVEQSNTRFNQRVHIRESLAIGEDSTTPIIDPATEGRDHVRSTTLLFYDENVAANQNAVAWGTQGGQDAGGSTKLIPMPFAGSIVGISVVANAACTSGTLAARATITDPTQTTTTLAGPTAGLNSVDDTLTSHATQLRGVTTFDAGDAIGVKVTTSSTWAPTTGDVIVAVTVEY